MKNYVYFVIRRIALLALSLLMTYPLQSQIFIRDTVHLSQASSQTLFSLESTILTATFVYRSDAAGATFQVDGPCGLHEVSANGGEGCIGSWPGCDPASVELVVEALDPGAYTFTVNYHPCTGPHFCSEYTEKIYVDDNHGNHWESIGSYNASVTATVSQNICSIDEMQPQHFDPSTFVVVSEGQSYQGATIFDCPPPCDFGYADWGTCVDTVNVCPTSPPDSCKDITFGVTGVYNHFNFSRTCFPAPTVDDIQFCLNPAGDTWFLKPVGLQMPLISTLCPVTGYTDLGDGTNPSLLHQIIQSCADFMAVRRAIMIWVTTEGSPCAPNDPLYYSSHAASAHEDAHLEIYKYRISKVTEDIFGFALTLPRVIGECDQTTIIRETTRVKATLYGGYAGAAGTVTETSGNKAALHAHQNEYLDILLHIRQWASTAHPDWFDASGNCVSP